MHNQYKIANQDQSQHIAFKAVGGFFQRQVTISSFILASILDETVVNVWQMLAENEGKIKKDGKRR